MMGLWCGGVRVPTTRTLFFIARSLMLALCSLALLLAIPVGDTAAQKRDKPQAAKPADIDRNGVLILVRTAMLALDQANKTGNYTVLRDLGAPAFQKNSAAQLGEIFASQRQQELDLGGVAVLEPQLTLLPQIEPSGFLHMAGFFPSVPMQVNFELLFAPVERQWKLFGISVNLSKGGPRAPETTSATEPEAAVSTEMPDPPTPTVNPRRLQGN
jgi:hypothetical protein